MRRTPLIVAGIILMLLAAPMLMVGAVLTAVGAGDPAIAGRLGEVRSNGAAVVSDTVDVDTDLPVLDRFDVTVGVRADGADEVFIGYGPQAEVQAYLAGVPYTLVASLGERAIDNRDVEVPGTAVPAVPGAQDFWVEQARGPGLQQIQILLRQGAYQIVAMNADGSPGIRFDVYGSTNLPFLRALGIAGLVLGALTGLLGLVLLVAGLRTPAQPAPPPYPYPGGAASGGYPYPDPAGPPHPGVYPYPGGADQAGPPAPPYPGSKPPAG